MKFSDGWCFDTIQINWYFGTFLYIIGKRKAKGYLKFVFSNETTTRIDPANVEHLLLTGREHNSCSRLTVLADNAQVVSEHQLLRVEIRANALWVKPLRKLLV